MFTHMQTYWIYSGNMEKHPQWTGHFMIIHTEYFTFNILTLQEHTLCIECKLARHSSRIVKYAIMLFATFRSLNTLRGIIAYRPRVCQHLVLSHIIIPLVMTNILSTCAKMTPKMPRADRQDIFQINSTGTTRCSQPKKWNSWRSCCNMAAGFKLRWRSWLCETNGYITVVDRQDTSLVTRCPVAAKCFKYSCEWAVSCHNTGFKLRRRRLYKTTSYLFLSQNVSNTTVNESLLS